MRLTTGSTFIGWVSTVVQGARKIDTVVPSAALPQSATSRLLLTTRPDFLDCGGNLGRVRDMAGA